MLYLVGLGLGDARDITLKGLDIVKKVEKAFLESYTSILGSKKDELEKLYGRPLITCDRTMMEQDCEQILEAAETNDGAAVLVVGDPLNATTHTDLLLRAANRKIPFQIIHNASILNAVACCGLQIYTFGETVSIPYWTDTWKPDSFYDKIMRNKKNGLHSLCLLDIQVSEVDMTTYKKGAPKVSPPKFMSFSEAAKQLLTIAASRRTRKGEKYEESAAKNFGDLEETSICIGLARVGSSKQQIVKTTLFEATKYDLGDPLHSLVIPGDLHPLEEEMIDLFSI